MRPTFLKVTLPLYRGVSKGQTVYYIILDASDGNAADQYGVNRSQKLANAANIADHGLITDFGGGTFDTSKFIVNCPIVSMN